MLSGGEAGDAPKGRELLERIGHTKEPVALLMDSLFVSTRKTSCFMKHYVKKVYQISLDTLRGDA
jgi:hypothetical protein